MEQSARPQGTFVISWAQTEIEGIAAAPVAALQEDAIWLWRGKPVRIDQASGFSSGRTAFFPTCMRRRAVTGARRIVSRALALEGQRSPYIDDAMEFERTFSVTDGQKVWVATLIEMPEIARPLLMFMGDLPTEGAPLFISTGIAEPTVPSRLSQATEGVVCFAPGTLLETPEGAKAVETLVAGDRVVTKDNGSQPILWAGSRNVSGARLYAMPDLRPVRIRAGAFGAENPAVDLLVSPDHRMLIGGAAAKELWGETEVLVAARDLVDAKTIARDLAAKSVTYHHLMLEDHNILVANRVETESFHPAAAALDAIEEDQRARLFDIMPDLMDDAAQYGPMSRRALTTAEAALLQSVAA